MRVTLLKKSPVVYSCNSYFIRGIWNSIEDVNTLIDPGTDAFIMNELSEMSTGVGKSRIEQVILTHEHFDHSGALRYILEVYKPRVIAFSLIPGVTDKAFNGMKIRIGDRTAEILHTPGHSNDSISIYIREEKTLFCGDMPLNLRMPGGTFTGGYLDALERLCSLDIECIYHGHDEPVCHNAGNMLKRTLMNVKASSIID